MFTLAEKEALGYMKSKSEHSSADAVNFAASQVRRKIPRARASPHPELISPVAFNPEST